MGKMSKWRKEQRGSSPSSATRQKDQPTPTMVMELEDVGPPLALQWLGKNIGNRSLSSETVKRYASDMRDGRWKTTFQGVAFDHAGYLLNGQHTLHAIIKADCVVTIAVFRNCDRDMFDCIDIGKMRSVADVLSVDDDENARAVAAIARSVIVFGYRERHVTNALVVQFARDCREELAEYAPTATRLTAACAAAFAFAATDQALRPTVESLLGDPGCREMDDLQRCVKLMSGNSGHASQRARYDLAMATIKRAAGGER